MLHDAAQSTQSSARRSSNVTALLCCSLLNTLGLYLRCSPVYLEYEGVTSQNLSLYPNATDSPGFNPIPSAFLLLTPSVVVQSWLDFKTAQIHGNISVAAPMPFCNPVVRIK